MKFDKRYSPTKKASTARGFMTADEIKDHLYGKSPEQQIQYLEKIRTKKGMLAEQTKHNVNRTLDRLYEQEISTASKFEYRLPVGSTISSSGKLYQKTKMSREEAANTNHISYLNLQRAELAEEEGEYENAIKLYGEVLHDKNRLLTMSDYRRIKDLMKEEEDLERKIEELNSKNQRQKRQQKDASVIKRLEGRLPVIISLVSLTSIFFLSSNITGNVVASLPSETTSFIEVSLLVIGLVSGFFWWKNNN